MIAIKTPFGVCVQTVIGKFTVSVAFEPVRDSEIMTKGNICIFDDECQEFSDFDVTEQVFGTKHVINSTENFVFAIGWANQQIDS